MPMGNGSDLRGGRGRAEKESRGGKMEGFEALVDAEFAAAGVGRGWMAELEKVCGMAVHGLRRAARVMSNRWAGCGPATSHIIEQCCYEACLAQSAERRALNFVIMGSSTTVGVFLHGK